MMLSLKDRNCFFEMWLGLLAFVNDKYKVIRAFGHPRTAKETKSEDAFAIRNKLWEWPDVIDEYIASVGDMSLERVHTLENWKNNRISGEFLLSRQLQKYAVFLDMEQHKLYGVLGITNPNETGLS